MLRAFIIFLSCAALRPCFGEIDPSLRREVDHALKKGAEWLITHQAHEGSWSEPSQPALTALPLTALYRLPRLFSGKVPDSTVNRAEQFILSHVQPDGGIYGNGLMNYNTSICLMALTASREVRHPDVIKNARKYLTTLQQDKGAPGSADSLYDGGIGYGTKDFSDLSNTYLALEALKISEAAVSDGNKEKLNWDLALSFIQRCQNLKSHNDQAYASNDSLNKGGFMYYPGSSKAGDTLINGQTIHRSYGSMSYAGLLSYIYADLSMDDPRVKAALDWLEKNYTLKENPGMGQQGYFYYLHVMAKTFKVLGIESFLTGTQTVDWKSQVAEKLVNLQRGDGAWSNEAGRWWESDPVLATAYAMFTLELCY